MTSVTDLYSIIPALTIIHTAHTITGNQRLAMEYLEITMAKELYSRGASILDISEKVGLGESTVRKIVEENKS